MIKVSFLHVLTSIWRLLQASLRPSPKPSAANSEYMSGRDLSGDEAATDHVAAGVLNLLDSRSALYRVV